MASNLQRVVLARSEEVPENGRIVVSVDGVEIAVFRIKSKLYAWHNYCAHAGGPVGQGSLIPRVTSVIDERRQCLGDVFSDSEMHIVCPWHGYEYNVETGIHPADSTIRLVGYPVTEEDGEVVVELG